MKRAQRLLTRFAAIVLGAFSGAMATFIHHAFVPIGLIVALLGSIGGALLVRSLTRSRVSISLFAIAWTAVIFRAGTYSGEELLIMPNTVGYTLLYLGPILVFAPVFLPEPKIREIKVVEMV